MSRVVVRVGGHNQSTQSHVMENNPPRPVDTRLTSRTSPMYPKSSRSPAKRDATRILAPQYNHATAPSDDVFNTGLLTPQASQNAIESDAAKSLISPPPEDTARTGSSRPSVCFHPLCPSLVLV
jgi:hypothetical protein